MPVAYTYTSSSTTSLYFDCTVLSRAAHRRAVLSQAWLEDWFASPTLTALSFSALWHCWHRSTQRSHRCSAMALSTKSGSSNGHNRSVGGKLHANGLAEPTTSSRPHYEFLGPPGALFIMLAVPLLVYALYFLCSPRHCLSRTEWPWQSAHFTLLRPPLLSAH